MADSPRIEELKRRVQMDPASIAFAALAEEYRRTGRYEDAIEVCRTGLQRHASYISAHVTLGRALMEVGTYDEARQELEYVLSVAPENLAAIRGLAEIHHRQGQSSDHTDYTASEMADMLAPRQPIPVAVEPTQSAEAAGKTGASGQAEGAEKTEKIEVVEEHPEIEVAPTADVGAIDPGALDAINLQSLLETPQPVPPQPVVAPPPAARASAAVPEPPRVDPALGRLEAFLQAILRARETVGSTHVA